jgi:hypothetical protein
MPEGGTFRVKDEGQVARFLFGDEFEKHFRETENGIGRETL